MKLEEIQERAKQIFSLAKDFEYIDVTILDDGSGIVELDNVEVYLNDNGEVEKTSMSL